MKRMVELRVLFVIFITWDRAHTVKACVGMIDIMGDRGRERWDSYIIHSIMEMTMQDPLLLLPLSVFGCCWLAGLHLPLLSLPGLRFSLLDAALGGCWLGRRGTELCRLLGGTKLGRLLGLPCKSGGLHCLQGRHSYVLLCTGTEEDLEAYVVELDELGIDGTRYL